VPEAIYELIGPAAPLGVLAAEEAGATVIPVRVLLFDKTPAANWAVPWHQDRTIAVKARHDVAGFGPWSGKGDVHYVEPPISILEGMLTLRLFVDDCDDDNGPLEVAIGSHQVGRLPLGELASMVRHSAIVVGTGRAGDVLVMKALAVHSSKRARSPAHRRVLHVDYATSALPAPLEWMLKLSTA
jgi:ectoine hydroxylase-related dioxygenase (phytanoyl-CoA dioxygenase family)